MSQSSISRVIIEESSEVPEEFEGKDFWRYDYNSELSSDKFKI